MLFTTIGYFILLPKTAKFKERQKPHITHHRAHLREGVCGVFSLSLFVTALNLCSCSHTSLSFQIALKSTDRRSARGLPHLNSLDVTGE